MNKKIAIVTGEPSSINSEIIAKSWKKTKKKYKKNIFLIGSYSLIKKQLKKLKIKISIIKINSINEFISSTSLKIFDVPLQPNYILHCINKAHILATEKKIIGFINCPVSKNIFKSKYSGVTEYLAKKNGVKDSAVMMIYNKNLSVVPISTHIPVRKISQNLNKKLIEKKIITINNFYRNKLKRKPKIAVLGLNPHNDEFRPRSEEKKIIIPVIKKLKKKRFDVIGPFSADTIFFNKKKYIYDIIVGMYHDQVLPPYKTLYGFDAINVTLGLKYIRISPDHGIAKDMVGLNKANPLSLIKAIEFIFKI